MQINCTLKNADLQQRETANRHLIWELTWLALSASRAPGLLRQLSPDLSIATYFYDDHFSYLLYI